MIMMTIERANTAGALAVTELVGQAGLPSTLILYNKNALLWRKSVSQSINILSYAQKLTRELTTNLVCRM